VVGGADVDVGEGACGLEELIGYAEIRDGFPDEERAREYVWCLYLLSKGKYRCNELDAARGGRDYVIGFGP